MEDRDEQADERPREEAPNPTQQRMGEGSERPVDVAWTDDEAAGMAGEPDEESEQA